MGRGKRYDEVFNRYSKALSKVLNENEVKTIAIFSHVVAMLMTFTKWCDLNIDKLEFTYKGKNVLDGKIDAPEIFKLVFEKEELINISNLRLENVYKL